MSIWRSIQLVSFRFDLFRFVLFRFVSICFVSFRSVSFRFDLFRFVSICFVSFRFVSVSFRTLQGPYILLFKYTGIQCIKESYITGRSVQKYDCDFMYEISFRRN